MTNFKIGDRVKHFDADEPSEVPAYGKLRGTVVAVNTAGWVKVYWDVDRPLGPDVHWRSPDTIKLSDEPTQRGVS